MGIDKQGTCVVCGINAKLFCSNCQSACYCGKDHQRQHWKIHREACKPFKVLEDEHQGRYIVASRDLKAGERVIREKPLMVGPKQLTRPVCLGCYTMIDGSYLCSRCQYPLCNPKCETDPRHRIECQLISDRKTKIKVVNFMSPSPLYQCIMPLRILSFKLNNKGDWSTVKSMETHHLEREKYSEMKQITKRNIVDFIRVYMGLKDLFTEDDVFHACWALEVNAFEIRKLNTAKIRGLYPTAYLMNHDCNPNMKHCFGPDYTIEVRTTRPVKKGQSLTLSYTQILWGTVERRKHLYSAKLFWCKCHRCTDANELGSNMSAIRCIHCHGNILPRDPLEMSSLWSCQGCNFSLTFKQVTDGFAKLENTIKELDKEDVEEMEQFVITYGLILNPNNYQLIKPKYAIVQLMGQFDPMSLDEEELTRLTELCAELLQLADIVDPVRTRFRGILLYYLARGSVALAKKTNPPPEVLKQVWESSLKSFLEAKDILQDEPPDDFEMEKIAECKKSIKHLEDILAGKVQS